MTGHGLLVTSPAWGAQNGMPEGGGYVYRRRQRTREAAKTRDVPRTCTCAWQYRTGPARWVRVAWNQACPWHLVAR